MSRTKGRYRAGLVAVALVVPLGLAACSAPTGVATRIKPGPATGSPGPSQPPAAPLALTVTPAAGTADLPVSAEIGTTVAGGKVTDVALLDAAGKRLPGELREDGTSWIPAQPLAHGAAYRATVTATGPDGRTATQSTDFTTMRRPGGTRVGTGLYLFEGNTYGVAMPVVVEFESDVPADARASVERRLFVRSDPPQPGAWRWFGARQVMYRPPVYWRTGTKLTVRAALGGHPIARRFGDMDRSATVTIGRDLRIDVDNATKQLTVTQDGQIIKTMPVSLGKPKTPSSSGTMVIMAKEAQTVFDTTATDGADGYRINISNAQRLTWGGQFLHAASWSERDQGVRNVSHGCLNISNQNAAWLFERTLVGDPVTVKGTERKLEPGDGWTAWNLPWAEYAPGAPQPAASAPSG